VPEKFLAAVKKNLKNAGDPAEECLKEGGREDVENEVGWVGRRMNR